MKKANILYHTQLSGRYDRQQPHFKSENVAQVSARIKKLSSQTDGRRILDVGCGTGFMLKLAKPYFKELCGVDITPAMLAQAKSKFKNDHSRKVQLDLGSSEDLKYPDGHFDMVSAYGFLHHLERIDKTLREAYRVLKKGGIFYSDQDPNYYFWQSMISFKDPKRVSALLSVERDSVCKIAKMVRSAGAGNIGNKVVEMAEFQKTKGGFKEEKIKELLNKIGYRHINYEYTWFWQEGRVVHDLSPQAALYVEEHLRQALPLTRHFFKYVRIIAVK